MKEASILPFQKLRRSINSKQKWEKLESYSALVSLVQHRQDNLQDDVEYRSYQQSGGYKKWLMIDFKITA
jgi:hypothetical protein